MTQVVVQLLLARMMPAARRGACVTSWNGVSKVLVLAEDASALELNKLLWRVMCIMQR